MIRRVLLLLLPILLHAEEWTVYRMGPFEVYSYRDKKQARDVLNHLEQLRWAFSYFTGKQEPRTLWTFRIVESKQQTSSEFLPISDSWRAFYDGKSDVPRTWNEQVVRILIEDNLGRMPVEIENGLIQVLSTTEISGTHVILGQPIDKPTLDWARMHYLMTSEDYRARVRVILANLAKGVEMEVAFRNAISKTRAEIDQAAQSHLEGKTVATFDLPGKPLNAAKDFIPRVPDEVAVRRATGDKNDPETAMGLVAAGKFDEASKVKPEWSLPFYELSQKERDGGKQAGLLKKSAELAPRDAHIWTEFAVLMMEYHRWIDADKAWAQAERAAIDAKSRDDIRARRSAMVEERAAAEEMAKREAKLAQEREIQQLKNEATARVRAAENKANAGKEPLDPNAKVVEWWDGPRADAKISGTLRRVDCQGKRLQLVVDSGGKVATLRVADPSKIVVEGSNQASLGCGVQKPARNVEVEYFSKSSEAAVIRFQ